MSNFFEKNMGALVSFVGTAVLSGFVFICSRLDFLNDDPFILYRYIDNLAAGNGFVYNLTEHVLGSTTPLFTLVCALIKYLLPFVATPALVALINTILLSFSAVFFYKLARLFLSSQQALLVVFVFALNLSRTIPEGMETPLFLLTCLAFLYYLLTERFYRSSVLLSLTLLTRPDAGLILVLAVLYWWQKVGWREVLRLTAVCALIALPWLVFSTWYFGSFVPQSLATKLHSHEIYHLSPFQGAKVQLAALSRIYWGKIFDPDNLYLQTLLNLLPLVALVLVGVWRKITKDTWVLLAIPVVYFLSFSISNPIIFPWYLSETEPLWILLSMMGIWYVSEKITHTFLDVRVLGTGIGKILGMLFLAAILLGPLVGWGALVSAVGTGGKEAYFDASAYINAHESSLEPQQRGRITVGAPDIGILGYLTGAYIVDFIGLVNTQSVAYYPIRDACVDKKELYTIPPKLLEATEPDWLVAGPSQMESCFLTSPWFGRHYRLVHTNTKLMVWRRSL